MITGRTTFFFYFMVVVVLAGTTIALDPKFPSFPHEYTVSWKAVSQWHNDVHTVARTGHLEVSNLLREESGERTWVFTDHSKQMGIMYKKDIQGNESCKSLKNPLDPCFEGGAPGELCGLFSQDWAFSQDDGKCGGDKTCTVFILQGRPDIIRLAFLNDLEVTTPRFIVVEDLVIYDFFDASDDAGPAELWTIPLACIDTMDVE